MNTKAIFSVLFTVAISGLMLAQGGPGSGAPGTGFGPEPPVKGPIDTNEIILIVAAILLTAGVVAYKKLSLKKA